MDEAAGLEGGARQVSAQVVWAGGCAVAVAMADLTMPITWRW